MWWGRGVAGSRWRGGETAARKKESKNLEKCMHLHVEVDQESAILCMIDVVLLPLAAAFSMSALQWRAANLSALLFSTAALSCPIS